MYKGLVESRNEGRAWELLAIWTSIRRALLTAVSTMLHWTSLKETNTSHVFVKHGCPQRQQRRNMAKISKSYILTRPILRGMSCQ